jgi:hypothetical protein
MNPWRSCTGIKAQFCDQLNPATQEEAKGSRTRFVVPAREAYLGGKGQPTCHETTFRVERDVERDLSCHALPSPRQCLEAKRN